MTSFFIKYVILIPAAILFSLGFTMVGINAGIAYRMTGDYGLIIIWLVYSAIIVAAVWQGVVMWRRINPPSNKPN